MRPLAGNAFLRPLQKRRRSASSRLTAMAVAPLVVNTSRMRPISSSTSSGVPSLSHNRIASAVRS
jgi:hypothetical protein